jgi:hypothetical protein
MIKEHLLPLLPLKTVNEPLLGVKVYALEV